MVGAAVSIGLSLSSPHQDVPDDDWPLFVFFPGNFLLHCLGMEASGKIPQASLGVQEHMRFTRTAITDGFWAPGLERTARPCICDEETRL